MPADRSADLAESDRAGDAPHPREAADVFGHDGVQRELLEAYRAQRLPHAVILGGREGIGKASLAWRIARFLLAYPSPRLAEVTRAATFEVARDHPSARRVASLSHPNLVLLRRELNEKTKKPFTEIRTEDVRKALDLFRQSAGEEGWRICILDSAEDLNRAGANALLKVIEEPPPASLFLIVAHRPANVLPTIRSRCRTLLLDPLSTEDVTRAILAMGEPWSGFEQARVASAAARSGGSVRDAIRLLRGDGLALTQRTQSLLDKLPSLDLREVHAVADLVAGRERSSEFEALVAAILDWLNALVRSEAPAGARRLAPLAQVWEKFVAALREVEALNLDRRPFLLSTFADLAAAVRVMRQ